jgi:diguanylate cyclase (GGDEF)-like protein
MVPVIEQPCTRPVQGRERDRQGVSAHVVTSGLPAPIGLEDPLSGLQGPDFWRRILVSEIARSNRYQRPLTIVVSELLGVDDLLEDWGPDVARHAVREAAQCILRTSRTSDYCARIGPSRFGIVLTETDEIAAINFVERVREAGPRFLSGRADGLQFTFGWASPKQGEAAEALVRRADRRLLAEVAPR